MTEQKHHPDLHRTVMYNGMICRIIGVTFSTRNSIGGWRYSVIPDGKRGLEHAIHDIIVDKLAFEPPVMGSTVAGGVANSLGGVDTASLNHIPITDSDKFITIDDAPFLELVKG